MKIDSSKEFSNVQFKKAEKTEEISMLTFPAVYNVMNMYVCMFKFATKIIYNS